MEADQKHCGNCDYTWKPRVPDPLVCPRCKVYLVKKVKKRKPKPEPEVIDVGT